MSFYNLIYGENLNADVLLAVVGITRGDVPRYRDCYWNGKEICIYTRTGGGNRDDYQEANNALCAKRGYIRDQDDDFDCTYATFFFRPPEQFAELVASLTATDATPEQRWEATLAKLKSGDQSDPQVQRIVAAIRPKLEAIGRKLEGGDS